MSSSSSETPVAKTQAHGPVRYGTEQLSQLIDEIGHSTNASIAAGQNPHAAIELVRQARLGALRVPRVDGGGGCSIREFFATMMDLAAVAPDIPHILRTHYWFVEERIRSTNRAERATWLERITRGDLFGNAVSELGGSAAVGTWVMTTKIKPSETGYLLNGKKILRHGQHVL